MRGLGDAAVVHFTANNPVNCACVARRRGGCALHRGWPKPSPTMAAVHPGAKAGDVIAFGHTRKPWHRTVDGTHFVNTGSVGRPKDGDWRAGYVLLDVDGGDTSVEFIRVEYDLEQTMRGIRESDLPEDFAEYLRAGRAPAPSPAADDA